MQNVRWSSWWTNTVLSSWPACDWYRGFNLNAKWVQLALECHNLTQNNSPSVTLTRLFMLDLDYKRPSQKLSIAIRRVMLLCYVLTLVIGVETFRNCISFFTIKYTDLTVEKCYFISFFFQWGHFHNDFPICNPPGYLNFKFLAL